MGIDLLILFLYNENENELSAAMASADKILIPRRCIEQSYAGQWSCGGLQLL